MKKIILILSVILIIAGCTQANKTNATSTESLQLIHIANKGTDDVYKFNDGDVTCYIYRGSRKGGISCLSDHKIKSLEISTNSEAPADE